MKDEQLEQQIVQLVANDRVFIPVSSLDNKLKKVRPKLAREVPLGVNESYDGERVFAYVEADDTTKARGMKEGIDLFAEQFPRYGSILKGMIEEKRAEREINLYFGLQDGRKLTSEDYVGVLQNLGFSETTSRALYPELINVSRKLSKQREEGTRSILVG